MPISFAEPQRDMKNGSEAEVSSTTTTSSSFLKFAQLPPASTLPVRSPKPEPNHIPRPRTTGGPYAFSHDSWSWLPVSPAPPVPRSWITPEFASNLSTVTVTPPPKLLRRGDTITFVTWNVDYSSGYARERIKAALSHLRAKIAEPMARSRATVILFQELYDPDPRWVDYGKGRQTTNESSMEVLLSDEWVQENFILADTHFPASYGTATLVSRGTTVGACFRASLPGSVMGRDVLGVDIPLAEAEADGVRGVLRICNVHLESLSGFGTRIRPVQLKFVANKLFREGENVVSGIVAGDMNAIDPPDFVLTAREDIRLRDVWCEYFPEEAKEEKDGPSGRKAKGRNESPTRGEKQGNTWGYQSGETPYWPRRLDKVLFWNEWEEKAKEAAEIETAQVEKDAIGVEPRKGGNVQRLGVDVQFRVKVDPNEVGEESDDEEKKTGPKKLEEWQARRGSTSGGSEIGEDEEEDEEVYASDHFGLLVEFVVGGKENGGDKRVG